MIAKQFRLGKTLFYILVREVLDCLQIEQLGADFLRDETESRITKPEILCQPSDNGALDDMFHQPVARS